MTDKLNILPSTIDNPRSPRMYTPYGEDSMKKFFVCENLVLLDIDLPFCYIPGLMDGERINLLMEIKRAINYLNYAYSQIETTGLHQAMLDYEEKKVED